MFNLPCVILCGGKSSRMGEDKALLPFSSSETLTQYQYNRLNPFFEKVYVSSKTNKFNFNVNLILDKEKEYSPIVALESIFNFLQEDEKVFIITVDTPLVTIDTIKQLILHSKNYDITVARSERIHNLCGVFHKNCLYQLKHMIKEDIHKVGFLLKEMNTKYIDFPHEDEFINLNDKTQYFKAKSIIS